MRKSIMTVSFCLLSAVIFYSCTKTSSSPDSNNFVGRWTGTGISTVNGVAQPAENDTFNFAAGSDGNHITTQPFNSGSCSNGTIFTFSLNGNSMSFPSTAVTDGCANHYTMSATGNLNSATLTLTILEVARIDDPTGSSSGGDTVMTYNMTNVFTLTK